jgi:hypothetical protein
VSTETALPTADQATAGQSEQTPEQLAATAALTERNRAIDTADENEADKQPKPEKTPEQREIERLRRGIDRKTRQLAEARAHAAHAPSAAVTRESRQEQNSPTADDDTPVSLTRAQLAEMVKAEAAKLAPTLREQASEVERRQSVVQGLAKTWGQQRFDEIASDLDDVFGGLVDRSGKPKPATDAVFEADEPAKVIEWLADPENADEAERISRMNLAQATKAITKLEAKLAGVSPKTPQSKAAQPLEQIRGQGKSEKSLADLSGKEFAERRRRQIAQRQ